jgi:tight adherence protein B
MNAEGAIGIGVAALIFVVSALLFGVDDTQRRLTKRMARFSAGNAAEARSAMSVLRVGQKEGLGIRLLERFVVSSLPQIDVLRLRLERTGRPIGIGRYAAFSVIIAAAVVVLCQAFGLSMLVTAGAAVALGTMVPHFCVGAMIAGRLKAFSALFPEAIDLMVRGLRSGLPIGETIANAAVEIADPVGVELRAVTDSVKLGRSLDDALWDAARRIDSSDFRFLVISLAVQRETGGNLAETLANLSSLLRKRRQMKLKIRAMSSEARASAIILGSLPFLMLGVLFLMNREYVMQLFTDPRGLWMVGAGVVSLTLGIAVMARMVRFDF